MWARLFGRQPSTEAPRVSPGGAVLGCQLPRRPPRLQQPGMDRKMLRCFGKKGSAKGCFNMPSGIAVTAMGRSAILLS